MAEKQIEHRLVKRVKESGGMALKFISPGRRGVPDRLVFMPGGKLYLVELKAPNKKPSKQQLRMKNKFKDLGFTYFVIDSYLKVEVFINEFCTT